MSGKWICCQDVEGDSTLHLYNEKGRIIGIKSHAIILPFYYTKGTGDCIRSLGQLWDGEVVINLI